MRKSNKLTLAGVAALLAFGVLMFAVVGSGEATTQTDVTSAPSTYWDYSSTTTLSGATQQATAWNQYSIYTVGTSFNGQNLLAIQHDHRDADEEVPRAQDYVTFLYGPACTLPASDDPNLAIDGGCPQPLQIQLWSASSRNLGFYGTGQCWPPYTVTSVRGVTAYQFDDRLEFQTGNVTVVIFGADATQEMAVANALRGLNINVAAGAPLPQPTNAAGLNQTCTPNSP